MNVVVVPAAILGGVALFFGVVLALAYRYLRVEEDPRIDDVEAMLPGSNCGACGQPGCRAFAEAVCGGTKQPGQCTVSAPEGIAAIAAYLGVEATIEERRVARLHCAGGKSNVRRVAEYAGLSSCRAAVIVNGGATACAWGCLGLADCERACTFGAIRMNDEDLPVVTPHLCTACNDCVEVCPRDLFTLVPVSQHLIVQCSSPLAGTAATDVCAVACDACGRCALDARAGAIEMSGGLPRIRIPGETTIHATFRCPTGAIRWVDGTQFQSESPMLDVGGGIRA
ncbi:RnfABCDGE type electron transport complex subunit B [bacterium]|nr:RnfABCDGE type electron transport complex subunit B [bacterium]